MNRRIRTMCVAALVVTGAVTTARGQGSEQHGSSISKVVRLNRAPVSKEVLKVKLPRPTVTKLPNGLTVLVLERHQLPTVAVTLGINSGALSDPKDLPGLASFTASMLREGTTHRSSAQLAEDVDDIGATLNASASFGSDITSVDASGLSTSADRLLELVSDLTLNPTFPADELAKFKKRQLANLQQERSEPFFLSEEKFNQVLYRSFPAAVASATPESVERVTPELLRKFHDEYYVPDNAILGVVGDVKSDEVVEQAKKYFEAWQGAAVKHPDFADLPAPAPFAIYLVDRPGSVQTNIVAGDYGARRVDPDYVNLVVMNRVLGGGPQARLFLNLREEKGYTYGAYSRVGDAVYRQPWAANTEVRTAVTDGSMHELMYEFKRIRDQQVPESELDEARHSIVASFALSLERPRQLLNYWLLVQRYGLPQNYWDRYPVEIAKVSASDLQKAAEKYVDLDHLQVVCVGDAKQIESALKKYGPVEVFDTNGKRLD